MKNLKKISESLTFVFVVAEEKTRLLHRKHIYFKKQCPKLFNFAKDINLQIQEVQQILMDKLKNSIFGIYHDQLMKIRNKNLESIYRKIKLHIQENNYSNDYRFITKKAGEQKLQCLQCYCTITKDLSTCNSLQEK